MIATRTTPARLLANEDDARTEMPTPITASGTSVFQRKLGFFIVIALPLSSTGLGDCSQARVRLSSRCRRPHPARPGRNGGCAVPDPHQPAGRDEHDQEEQDPDDRVERPAEEGAAEAQARHL